MCSSQQLGLNLEENDWNMSWVLTKQLPSSSVLPLSCSGLKSLCISAAGKALHRCIQIWVTFEGKLCICCFSLLVKLVVPWVDVQRLERTSNVFLTDTIRITTQNKERDFSMFLNLDEVFKIMEQLADVTLRRLLDNEGFDLDPGLQEPSQITKR